VSARQEEITKTPRHQEAMRSVIARGILLRCKKELGVLASLWFLGLPSHRTKA
jgi:hypothetical protein